jgi:hypothetical protein
MSGEMIDMGICPECHDHCEAEYPEEQEEVTVVRAVPQELRELSQSCSLFDAVVLCRAADTIELLEREIAKLKGKQ